MIETLTLALVHGAGHDPRRRTAMSVPRVQVTAGTEVRDGRLVLPFAALPVQKPPLLGQEFVVFEPDSGWEACGRVALCDYAAKIAFVDVPSFPPEGRSITMTLTVPVPSRPDWNAPTMVGQVDPVRAPRPVARPQSPRVLAMVPQTTDLLLPAEILRAVALWYEREYGCPMPAGCVRQEHTASGPALVIYARPVV